jgi:hypothetical protein
MKSRFLTALLVFAVLNLVVAVVNPCRGKAADFPEMTWTGWAVKHYIEGPKPNVVFLGSSLMLVPLDGVDANYLNQKIDGSQHHSSVYFESVFKKLTGADIKTFIFALPGEMPSDACLITRNMLSGAKKPDVIVYGVGPRDFMDNLLISPCASDPYRYLSRFGVQPSLVSNLMPDWTDRLNYEFGQACYLYGNKTDLVCEATRGGAKQIEKVLPAPPGSKFTIFDRHMLMPDYHPWELSKGEALFRPIPPDQKIPFEDNLTEYRKRYATVKWDMFVSQMQFLADLMNTARKNGTHVVLVEMPITDLNRSLLKPYAWKAYRNGIKALARAKGATFINLEDSGKFETSDFGDTVHLHSRGGQKLLDLIAEKMAQNAATRIALKLPKTEVAKIGGGTL